MARTTMAGRPKTGRTTRAAWIALAAFAIEPASAQDAPAAAARRFSIVPSVSLNETLTDNAGLTASDRKADAVTESTAAVRIDSRAGRVKGFLDYALTARLSARDTDASDVRQALNALIAAELIENTAFVDLRGSISQQAISAFGKQTFDPGADISNQTQVASFGISPYVRGRLGSLADYEVRLDHSQTRSGTTAASDSKATSASGRLGGGSPGQSFSWTLETSRQVSDFSDGFHYESDRLRAVLSYAVTPQLTLSAIAGREANDFESDEKKSYNTSGAQLRWVPNQRTSLSALFERRFFGNAHSVDFSYRTPRTVWTFSDSRDVSTTPERLARVRIGTVYDLFFVQFASIEPDPVLRDLLVRRFMQANGLDPNAPIFAGFLTSGATVQRIQLLSFALVGIRDTLTFRTLYSNSAKVSRFAGISDFSEATQVRQRGLFVDLAHRLTPASSANLAFGRQRNTGSLGEQASTLSSLSAFWSMALDPRIGLSGGARYVRFSSATQPYTERAVFASVRVQF